MGEHITVHQAVANGTAWLDLHYPDWFKVIDLNTLVLSNCELCVLGQVYTGCIPADEKEQLVAQIVAKLDESPNCSFLMRTGIVEGQGFQILAVHEFGITDDWLIGDMAFYGFTESSHSIDCDYLCEQGFEYGQLEEEWTRVIIQRRLDQHPDVRADLSRLASIEKEPVTV